MAMATTSTTTNEKNRKKPTLAQTIDQVMTIKTHTESSKTELSSGGKRPFKVWRFFFKINFFPPMEGIFFSRRTVGSFFFPHATEGVAYITSAQDNIMRSLKRCLMEKMPTISDRGGRDGPPPGNPLRGYRCPKNRHTCGRNNF